MRILFASDFHYHLPYFTWLAGTAPRFDLTVYGGDFLDVRPEKPSAERQISWCRDWLDGFPGTILCAEGNHDAPDRIDLPTTEAGWLHKLSFPHVKTAGKHKIGGLPFEIMGWGEQPALGSVDSKAIWISHCPPRGSACAITPFGFDFGDLELGARIEQPIDQGWPGRPWLVLSGHLHSSRSWHDRLADATFNLNPQVNRTDGMVPNHIIISTETRRATWHSGRKTDIISLR